MSNLHHPPHDHTKPNKARGRSVSGSVLSHPNFEEFAETIELSAGETLFKAGDRVDAVHQVVDGLLRVETTSNGRAGTLIFYFEPGATIGLSFLDWQPFTVIAVKPSRVIAFDRHKLSAELVADVYAAARIVSFATKPLADVITYMRLRRIPDVTVRIASYLLLQFDRRGDVAKGHESVALQGTRREWALLLGTSSDLIGAAMRTLVDLKIIERLSETRFALCDRKALEMLANPDH
jgi:CRP-like cAMP-binding protein